MSEPEIKFVKNESEGLQLARLSNLLEYKFIIPLFQRPYAWDHNHFKDLLETIKENREQKRAAFLGSVIVALKQNETSDFPGGQNYLLIDGQQRITSFLLLLKLVRIKLRNGIQEIDENIKEMEKLKEEAKRKPDMQLFEKYVNKKRDNEEKKKEYKDCLEGIEKILKPGRIERESQSSEALEQNVLKYIFNQKESSNDTEIKKIKELFDEEVDTQDVKKFLDYVLKKCSFCFLTVTGGKSEDYAIDIFNSLNSTGEPLTAFEILKSLVHKKFNDKKEVQEELTEKFNEIEKQLDKEKIKKGKQNKYTDRLILFINMMTPGLQSEKTTSFRDKKEILDNILNLKKNGTQKCTKEMYSLHDFILKYWEKKEFSLDHPNYMHNYGEDWIIFDFLQSIGHDRVLPVLYSFKDSKELGSIVKSCAGFTCLWRGFHPSAGTDRIDKQYEEIIKSLFKNNCNIQSLKNYMLKLLKERDRGELLNKEKWIDKFKTIDIYKQKKLSRFLLFIAFHKRKFENKKLEISKLKFLTVDNWHGNDYKTVEHITPRSYKSIDKIGNLILLPQNINSKVGNKSFPEKKKIYNDCINQDSNDMPYIPILKEIVSYKEQHDLDDNHYLGEQAIDARGERLGNSIWRTLAEDWLGWKN